MNENETAEKVANTNSKPEIADRPSFLKDIWNGFKHVAKVVWQVPAARGYIATLIVRAGVSAPVVAVLAAVIDGLVK